MATKWQEPPRDALDTLVLGHVDISTLNHLEQVSYISHLYYITHIYYTVIP